MNQNLIYFPCLAMLILTVVVMIRMFLLRVDSVKKKAIDVRYFKTYNFGNPPSYMLQADRNFINLFEVPVLFYMVCAFSLITFHVDAGTLWAAWAFVLLRCIHSVIHLTANKIGYRMASYTASWVVLLYMAISLGLKITKTF